MVCDPNNSDDLTFFLEEKTPLVGVQYAPDQIDPSNDILCNTLHLSEEWKQCQDCQQKIAF